MSIPPYPSPKLLYQQNTRLQRLFRISEPQKNLRLPSSFIGSMLDFLT